MSMENVLSIRNLSIRLKERPLVSNVSFDLSAGEVVLLSGSNGIGKSSILKSILRLEEEDKSISGEIIHKDFGNVLALDGDELQKFRAAVAYVQQKDDYSEMGNVQVRDIISDSSSAFSGKSLSAKEVNDLIDEWIPRREDHSRVFDAKSRPARFSGGEQRLLSVFSIIATRADANLMIIDEPLNNLDYVNARNISNLINKVVKENPRMGVLMVSHCRIFPFITREIKLTRDGIREAEVPYQCHSCFGEPNADGYFEEDKATL